MIHQENGGLSAARNTGIEWVLNHSQCEWITFIDSDDWVHRRYLEYLYQAVKKTGCAISACGVQSTSQEKDLQDVTSTDAIHTVSTEQFYCGDKMIATIACGKLYPKSDFEQIRYPEGKIHEDELTTHKLLFRYPEIAFVDLPLYQYFQNQQGIMRGGWSPKHISEVEGMADQLRMFLDRGLTDAASCAAKAYLHSIYRNLMLSRKAGEACAAQSAVLHKMLRQGLHRHEKLAGVSIAAEPWLYYEAFPLRSLPHRVMRRIRRKRN